MKQYDILVIGSGSGMAIVDESLSHGFKVALVDRGPFGGTCLNLGCIPSKMLIYPADRIAEIQEAGKLGISAQIISIDFPSIMKRMRDSIGESQEHMRHGISHLDGLDLYNAQGHFIDDYTVDVDGEKVKGDKVVMASGSRPLIPPIKGLDKVDYLTNETVLRLNELPDSLIIIGGGYIAVEYGHFFAAMGTRVTLVEMADRLVLAEEPEISEVLKQELSKRMQVLTGAAADEVIQESKGVSVLVKAGKAKRRRKLFAQNLMVAVGRRSNADLLKIENTGVETDQRGFITVNEYLETSKKDIWALGDANGQQMFTHVANREAAVVAHNIIHEEKVKMDYSAIPHAVFSHPQIASVGMTEEQAGKSHDILVGMANYMDVAKGEAMMEESGFAKAIVEKHSGKILGFHIIGPSSPILIQEVVNAMTSGGNIDEIGQGIHIHPALTEIIESTLANIEWD
ncbi:dihydrolipoyl dehydrogenase [Chloroflexota bacterium]